MSSIASPIIYGLFVRYSNNLGLYDFSYWMNYGTASNWVNLGRVYNSCYSCLAGDLPYHDVVAEDIDISKNLFNKKKEMFFYFFLLFFYKE